MKKTKKRSARERRILIVALLVAAAIVAGSTFAWFTSKDEVTNRLTATAGYGVSIVEDFTPPTDMTPGQTVNKDVSVVNTGSVDAFVRLSLKNYINMSRLASKAVATTVSAAENVYMDSNGVKQTAAATVTDAAAGTVTDNAIVSQNGNNGLYVLRTFTNTYTAPTGAEAKVELSAIEKQNPDGTKTANEVTTLMAGGRVMVAGSKAVAPEDQAVRSGDDINGGFAVVYKYFNTADNTDTKNGKYYVNDSGYKEVTKDENGIYTVTGAVDSSINTNNLTVDALTRDYSGEGQYTPQNAGLYIFQRTGNNIANVNADPDPNTTNYTYSGFLYEDNKFYALKTQTAGTSAPTTASENSVVVIDGADIVLEPAGSGQVVKSIANLKLLTKVSDIANSADNKWTLEFYGVQGDDSTKKTSEADINNDAKFIKATFKYTTGDTNPVVFWIKLDDDWAKAWTYIAGTTVGEGYSAVSGDTGNVGYFYYRTKLDSGDTSYKLIDSITLDSNMTTANYLDLVYDLNVALDSVQVTKDENNHETTTAIPSDWAAHGITKSNAAAAAPADATTIAPAGNPAGDGVDGTIDWVNWGIS